MGFTYDGSIYDDLTWKGSPQTNYIISLEVACIYSSQLGLTPHAD
jgi:hypothetical protein